jgi:hypothetical protein
VAAGIHLALSISLTLFEKVAILQELQPSDSQNESDEDPNQVILFDS